MDNENEQNLYIVENYLKVCKKNKWRWIWMDWICKTIKTQAKFRIITEVDSNSLLEIENYMLIEIDGSNIIEVENYEHGYYINDRMENTLIYCNSKDKGVKGDCNI